MSFNNVLIGIAVSFAMRQIQKFAEQTDWNKVKVDLAERVKKLIPGEFLDEEGMAVSNRALEIVEKFLKSDTDERIAKMLVEGKSAEAFAELLAFVKAELGI